MPNNYYNKNLQGFANNLRKSMTKAEACLWKYALRACKMKGYTFRRQRPILNYIVDFVCLELKLEIEVDGYTHSLDETILKDELKQNALEKAGYCVIRFSDRDVLRGMNHAIGNIEYYVEQQEQRLEIHPLPPPAGDREGPINPPPAPASGG